MHTITFYSYKGGVGRSLLVANAAKYLSTLGKKVLAIDLDLEAPGLHYKFELDADAPRSGAQPGVVDILAKFLLEGDLPRSLASYVSDVPVSDGAGSISVMRAGTAPLGEYWRLLSQVNWYELLYGPRPVGAPFFLELKQRINLEFKPDFLLIDARTGITEMGGIATTLLTDSVVCLGLASMEHMEGLRAVMHGIRQTKSASGASVKLVAVISRLPISREENGELSSILSFLNEPIKKGGDSLGLDEVVLLHSEPQLDAAERLLVGGRNDPHDLPLLRDYLRLFAKIIPAEDVKPYVGRLIQKATERLLDDPDAAQSELEALTTYCADQEAYRALIKLYHLRRAPIEKTLATARLMWQLESPSAPLDPLLIGIINSAFSEPAGSEIQKKYADFAEAVWRATPNKDVSVGLAIVEALLPDRRGRAIRLLSDYVSERDTPEPDAIVRLIQLLRMVGAYEEAFGIVERFKPRVFDPTFYVAWARLVLEQGEIAMVDSVLHDPSFDRKVLRSRDPVTLYKLLKLVQDESAEKILLAAIGDTSVVGNTRMLVNLGEVFVEENRIDEFERHLSRLSSNRTAEEVMDHLRTRSKRPGSLFRRRLSS
jgi:hypothetical protein